MEKDSFYSHLMNVKKFNINNKYNNYFNNISNTNELNKLPNLILYGPPGIGKYSEALKIIEKFSLSELKYEKKMVINSLKNDHIIKISDIHYEINVENLTCISKQLFNDIYNNIIDSIESSYNKNGIILIKNFHVIDLELNEVFYSYMQSIINSKLTIKFIILTEHLSFINKNILDICKVLYYSKLTKSNYLKLSNSNNKKYINNCSYDDFLKNSDSINCLKYNLIENSLIDNNLNNSIVSKIVEIILTKNLDYVYIRNVLYDLLIYNLNISECIFLIIENIIIKKQDLKNDFLDKIYFKTCEFFKYFNNNYRPIYHMENYILFIIDIIHND